MRLVMLSTTAPPRVGGLQQVIGTLVRSMELSYTSLQNDFAVESITLLLPYEYKPHFDGKFSSLHVDFYQLETGIIGTLRTRRRVAKLLRKYKPNIIHCHDVAHDSLITPKTGGASKIVTSHGGDLAHHKKKGFGQRITFKGRLLVRMGLLDVDFVVAVSEAQARFAREVVHPEKIWVIPNPVDSEDLIPVSFSGHGVVIKEILESQDLVILSMSGSRELKDIDTSIRAFKAAKDAGLEAIYVQASSGELMAEMESLADELGVGANTYFIGDISGPTKIALLEKADIYLTSSHYEAFGLAPLEAAQADTAVVASSAGALCENFKHAESAYLFEPGNHLDAAKGLLFASDTSNRKMLAEGGSSVVEKYRPEIVVHRMMKLYAQIVNQFPTSKDTN